MKNSKPILSVLMPVYNGERYLRDAIYSVLTQTFRDFELIILNDGSVDKTEEIILSYHDPRIRYIKNSENLRLIKTLNKGLELAAGDFIARMDADDICIPERFEKQLHVFEKKPEIDIVNIEAYHLNADGTSFREQKSSLSLTEQSINFLIVLQNFICHPGVMVKAGKLKKYKYLDNSTREHIEDFDLWNRMFKDGCTCYTINECLLYYRDNPSSINHTQKAEQFNRMLSLCSEVITERFNYKFHKPSLAILLGETTNVNYKSLARANKELMEFYRIVGGNAKVPGEVLSEMNDWRKQKMVLLSLRSLNGRPLSAKLQSLSFLLLRIKWLTNSKPVQRLISRTIYSPTMRRPTTGIKSLQP